MSGLVLTVCIEEYEKHRQDPNPKAAKQNFRAENY